MVGIDYIANTKEKLDFLSQRVSDFYRNCRLSFSNSNGCGIRVSLIDGRDVEISPAEEDVNINGIDIPDFSSYHGDENMEVKFRGSNIVSTNLMIRDTKYYIRHQKLN